MGLYPQLAKLWIFWKECNTSVFQWEETSPTSLKNFMLRIICNQQYFVNDKGFLDFVN